ncbi:MAG TPA: hypothetical protein EYH05_09110 [Anaerolineae bacterium]|nr:hypothetical protein [Anaerolineae bacterium]
MQETVRLLTGQPVTELDFTNDRLADTLRHLSDDETWGDIEMRIGRHVLRVYDLPEPTCVRLDATSDTVTHDESKHTLFRRGWSKNGKTEVQFKAMMSTIDPLGLPVAVDVAAGNKADNPLMVRNQTRNRRLLSVLQPAASGQRLSRGKKWCGPNVMMRPVCSILNGSDK